MQSELTHVGHAHMRPRRLRTSANLRSMVQENTLSPAHFIWPIFISEPKTQRYFIPSLPDVARIPFEELEEELSKAIELGLQQIMLFPVIDKNKKDLLGAEAYNPNGLMQQSIQKIKNKFPQIILYADIALDPYTSHGHDGLVDARGYVLNDETIAVLCKQALSYATCGVDFVCPSDMMDGRIGAIRTSLDAAGFTNTGIVSYSAKYASAFYGPFREAVASGARGLDKKSYQLNPANTREALREVDLDVAEGADMLIIKPGLPYLDIVAQARARSSVPILIYQVSAEYSMLKMAAKNNIIDEKAAVYETFLCMRRAGASGIISYYAPWACQNLF